MEKVGVCLDWGHLVMILTLIGISKPKYSRDRVCNEHLSSQLKFQSQWKCYLISSSCFQFFSLCCVFTFVIGGSGWSFFPVKLFFLWHPANTAKKADLLSVRIRFIRLPATLDLKARRTDWISGWNSFISTEWNGDSEVFVNKMLISKSLKCCKHDLVI